MLALQYHRLLPPLIGRGGHTCFVVAFGASFQPFFSLVKRVEPSIQRSMWHLYFSYPAMFRLVADVRAERHIPKLLVYRLIYHLIPRSEAMRV